MNKTKNVYNTILKHLKQGHMVYVEVHCKMYKPKTIDRIRYLVKNKSYYDFFSPKDDTGLIESCFTAGTNIKTPEELVNTMRGFDNTYNLKIKRFYIYK